MTISVEIENPELTCESGHTVHIVVDRSEIEQLKLDLDCLANGKTGDSIRLFSQDWGTGDLPNTPQLEGTKISHFLRIWLADDGSQPAATNV